MELNSLYLTDAYKYSHHEQYPKGTIKVNSNFTPRDNKYAPKACVDLIPGVLVFGIQLGLKKLVEHFDESFFFKKEREIGESLEGFGKEIYMKTLKKRALEPVKEEVDLFFGTDYNMDHFEMLWDLGYLPISVRALDEGTICPIKVPMLTIENTFPGYYWLPNFLESILSEFLWKPVTSATIALAYRKIIQKWALETNPDGIEGVKWQGHDFSMRGLDSVDVTIASGLGHLTSFYGTDSMPVLKGARHYYNAKGFIAGSVPATEHSVMSAGSKEGELETFKRLLSIYPKGILSVVSDTWDLWNVVKKGGILDTLRDEILGRDGKLVIRPDSGDPVDILCGTSHVQIDITEDIISNFRASNIDVIRRDGNIQLKFGPQEILIFENSWDFAPSYYGVVELLWNLFGGTVNAQGYKVLDSHIGAIYGDSITPERADMICQRLEAKGFASTNVVFGIGSYTYQYNTRDTFGFALKATYVEKSVPVLDADGKVIGEEIVTDVIFKDPITDSGMKKSAKGLVTVVKDGEDNIVLKDEATYDEVNADTNLLKLVLENGKFVNEVSFETIRERVDKLV